MTKKRANHAHKCQETPLPNARENKSSAAKTTSELRDLLNIDDIL